MAQPEMMAIGDSLFNGVRSLTINAELAKWSVPAQVAKALGIPFRTPTYPRAAVINMENWLRMLPDIDDIDSDVSDNIAAWLADVPAPCDPFDNIAIASTTFSDMFTRTWKVAQGQIDTLKGQINVKGGLMALSAHLGELFFAFNTRFLLNPSLDPSAPAKSSLEIAAERKPKRLLVSIGANNGLWEMGFDGNPDGFTPADINDLQTFILGGSGVTGLATLPAEIQHIYLNTLPLPSSVANLMPIPDGAESVKPGPGKYFANYENRFSLGSYAQLSADAVAAMDQRVAQVNNTIQQLATKDPRIHIVRQDEVLKKYDSKHNADAAVVVTHDGTTLSNVMTEAGIWPFPQFRCGGLMGLDGMHPTIVGYGLMAQQVLAAIQQEEGIAATYPIDLPRTVYDADTLLDSNSNPNGGVPRAWAAVLWAWRDIRRAKASGVAAPQGDHEDATQALMKAIRFKID